jgi:LmbE family N-acetylglucosaminyl deacetylase
VQRLTLSGDAPIRILAIGAHADDIEIGCGGTLLRLAGEGRIWSIRWLVLSALGDRVAEARAGAAAFTTGIADVEVDIGDTRDGFFPAEYGAIKERFERLKSQQSPDLILAPRRDDLHQDHRLACELTWNTFRDHLILEYEVPKWDGDLGRPNLYVPLADRIVERKLDLLERYFPTQAGKHWYEAETFRGLMRLRGLECASPSRYAEAFYARKVVVSS